MHAFLFRKTVEAERVENLHGAIAVLLIEALHAIKHVFLRRRHIMLAASCNHYDKSQKPCMQKTFHGCKSNEKSVNAKPCNPSQFTCYQLKMVQNIKSKSLKV